MKANENLMVGDWVKFKGSDLYHQVKVVSNKSIKFDNQKWFAKSSVEPIPLTQEILEKNGFRIVHESEFYVSYFQDIQGFHTEVKVDKDGIFQKLSMWDGFGNKVTIIECKFVHQLQHALRLCGIEKEITL